MRDYNSIYIKMIQEGEREEKKKKEVILGKGRPKE
jgi:hypothetical protein